MTAAQEGQVIPFALAVTFSTCAHAWALAARISNASKQICFFTANH